jgi:hypothetical protein
LIHPAIGQKVVDGDVALSQPNEHISQVEIGVNTKPLACVDESHMNARCLQRLFAADLQPILPSYRDWADRVLNQICIEAEISVLGESAQLVLPRQGIVNRDSQGCLRRCH